MTASNQAQIDLWNGRVGAKWAEMQVSLDAWVAPVTAELRRRAGAVAGLRVLDIGCGNGETCVLWLEAGASVTGVDVSDPMLAVAEKRTNGGATLVLADASEWRSAEPFDLAVSQFGVMFFAEPEAAFANIAANVRLGGRLLFTCWRPEEENEWVRKPLGAVRDLLPTPASAPSGATPLPGPFALADRARIERILQSAGFAGIAIERFDFPVCLAREGGVEAAVRFTMQIGPTSAALAEGGKAIKPAAAERLRAALAPHDRDGVVTLGGSIWIAEAIRPN